MRDDWIECEANLLGDLVRGINYKKPQSSDIEIDGYLPILRANNINNNTLNFENLKYVKKELIKCEQKILKADIIFAMSSGSKHLVGKSGQAQKNYEGSFGAFCSVFRPNKNINSKFIQFYFHSGAFRSIISTASKGSNINNLKRDHVLNAIIPLPPNPEQRAIVAKIEELFSDLDKGIADLKKAYEQLKVYRQAVLKKAFEGILEKKALGECGIWKGGGTPSSSVKEYWENGKIPWVSSRDVKTKKIHDTERHITEIAISNSSTKWIEKDALLFVMRSGILRRIFPIAIAKRRLCVNQDIQTVSLYENWNPEFLYWYLVGNESDIRNTCSKDGTTVESVDAVSLKLYEVPFCSLKVQDQIVQKIESLLTICETVELSITESLEKAKALRQSILKKAFEGTLLSQDEIEKCKQAPDYEPASVLLERIKKENNNN